VLEDYKKHCKEREEMGIPPLPLDAEQTAAVINLLKNDHDENELLLFLLKERVPAGVDDAAYVKAGFLSDLTKGETESPYISKEDAVEILGTMLGGYNIQPLIDCLEIDELADDAAAALSNTLLIFDSFNDIFELSKTNEHAKKVINSWANAEWFTSKEDIPENIKLTVFKVPGEI
jgi:aconitate hydratase 2/2-methylisocitrate dehydratase